MKPPRTPMKIRCFKSEDEPAVIALWQQCDLIRRWNDPHRDICRKLKVNPEWFLVGLVDGQVVATIMAGYEGHRGWPNYLAVVPGFQRRGLAQIRALGENLLLLPEPTSALLEPQGFPLLDRKSVV